jgi:predicted phosphodiesterase
MRIAIVSDIHGNRTALEAVVADLRQTSPDLILHGGDLPHGGSSPAGIVDRIRDLGWEGIAGNTDEMLWRPASLTEFARLSPALQPLWDVIAEMSAATCEALGEERIAWLSALPSIRNEGPMTLVHASPWSLWRAPAADASDDELESVYQRLGAPLAVYAHIHCPFVRRAGEMTVVNTGSVGLPYDGDPRAAYLLLDDFTPTIRRVEYDTDREIRALADSGIPHAGWVAKMLQSARPCMP